MITIIAEHSVDLSLLPEKANILDLGCRGFLFANELRRLGHRVVCVDMDDLDGDYIKKAVTWQGPCAVPVWRCNDPQATRIGEQWRDGKLEYVVATNIPELSAEHGVVMWDLIKMDIEGAEQDIIWDLKSAPAKQFSIEFHLHTKVYGEAQVKEMEDKLLSLGYFPAKHDKTAAHGMGMNYWDSLWILK